MPSRTKKLLIAVFIAVFLIPLFGFAQVVPNPIKIDPASSPQATVIDIVFASLAGFSAVIAIIAFGFVIVNGFKLVIARDNEEALTKAKQGITWSVFGFIVALLAFSLIASVSTLFGGTGASELKQAGGNALVPPIAACAGSPGIANGFICAFTRVINGILGVTAATAILMIIYAGLKMIFSGGNEEQVTKAKTILKWAVAGLAIIVISFTIINGVNRIFTNQANTAP